MTSSLRQEEIIQYAEAFDMYDVDDEQRILITQLPLVLSTIGKTIPQARVEALKERKAAEGSDKFLTFDEFLSLLGCGKTVSEVVVEGFQSRAEGLTAALSLYDVGNSGYITIGEARRALAEVMSEQEFEGIVASVNGEGEGSNGKIEIDAVVKYIVGNL